MEQKKITKQEAFDRVWNHFVVNKGKPSIGPYKNHGEDSDGCVYRGPEGAKCAMGLLIPDELYKPEMEGLRSHVVCERHPEVGRLFDPEVYAEEVTGLLVHLQSAHDGAAQGDGPFTEEVEVNLRSVAARFGLKIP